MRDIPGGGFLYTNKRSVSVGVVASGCALVEQGMTIDEVLEKFKSLPDIARLLEGAELIEYSAHLVPEGGLAAMPKLYGDGILIAGDAAGFCLNTGITLQGINLAISSGKCAGETALDACKADDVSSGKLSRYETLAKQAAALSAMESHPKAAELLCSKRMSHEYPDMINSIFGKMVTIGPGKQQGMKDIVKSERAQVRFKDLLHDLRLAVKSL
jgi:electron transfer flavoprotein-quinone oxidoreductase